MVKPDQTAQVLREALNLSPDNIVLRQHLAETLMNQGRPEEAAEEFRLALAKDPANVPVKLGLAQAFYRQGKNSEALVLVEDLLKRSEKPAHLHLLYARLLLNSGEVENAVRHYHQAIEADPSLADDELAERLGIGAKSNFAEVVEGRLRSGGHEELPLDTSGRVERPKITFQHVGGMDGVKDEIRMKIIHPLRHPELYQAYGKSIGGGILMYGPPGCGKTHLARATAGEVQATFIAVGISEVLDMWIGQSERNLHEVFEQARGHKPCVLFFDEVDALGVSRTDLQHGGARQLINQFLSELDGIHCSNEGVLILAATNAPWHMDSAFRRPGRFDRILFVPPPDGPARVAILRILCHGKPVLDLDYEQVAAKTDTFSGADLRAVVDLAVEEKLRQALKDGQPKPITTKDLLKSAAGVRPSTKEWFATARNYALYANQGGIYDDIHRYLKL